MKLSHDQQAYCAEHARRACYVHQADLGLGSHRGHDRLREKQQDEQHHHRIAERLCHAARLENQDSPGAVTAVLQPRPPAAGDDRDEKDARERKEAHSWSQLYDAPMPPFRAEHIGSLLRPKGLVEGAEDEAIAEAIRWQERLGLRLVTDGEFRRESWRLGFV